VPKPKAVDPIRKEDLAVTVHACGALNSPHHVIIEHLPTGLVASCCRLQSEIQNKNEALKALRRALKMQGWTLPLNACDHAWNLGATEGDAIQQYCTKCDDWRRVPNCNEEELG
jgi:hypothetical protein